MIETLKDNIEVVFELDTENNLLTIPKSELKNVDLIISEIKSKTQLSVFDIYDLDLRII